MLRSFADIVTRLIIGPLGRCSIPRDPGELFSEGLEDNHPSCKWPIYYKSVSFLPTISKEGIMLTSISIFILYPI